MSKSLREEMPITAAFLDSLRDAFGKEAIDGQVRKGLNGEPTFWARENGRRLGTRDTGSTAVASWNERDVSFLAPPAWIVEARAFARGKGETIAEADPYNLADVLREAKQLRELVQAARQQKTSADVCKSTEGSRT